MEALYEIHRNDMPIDPLFSDMNRAMLALNEVTITAYTESVQQYGESHIEVFNDAIQIRGPKGVIATYTLIQRELNTAVLGN